MAGTSLLTLIDDIASLLDDVSLMTKIAAKKTAGVLGDDLALNAQQVAGVNADRELPVVWAVAKGSLRNKAILVPAALAVSAFAPWAITPLLMVGGAYLCFEGFEKIAHSYLHKPAEDSRHHGDLVEALADPATDILAFEQEKIRGAVRTDFILSAEIIVISLGTVATAGFAQRVSVLAAIAAIMTFGVYGLVAGIVKLDDAGFYLSRKAGPGVARAFLRKLGLGLVGAAPYLMKGLSVLGTIAMFLVGGGILTHGLPWAHERIHAAAHALAGLPLLGPFLAGVTPMVLDGLAGLLAGALVLLGVTLGARLFRNILRRPRATSGD